MNDLRDVVRFIALDNADRAASFGLKLIERVEKLSDFPEMGRAVPERRDSDIREVISPPYRVIYRLSREDQKIEIVRVWHAARGAPEGF